MDSTAIIVESSGSNKRRRKTTTVPPTSNIQNLTHLPTDQLVHIAEYLPKTSRALFAVALTAPLESWRASEFRGEPSGVSKAIIAATQSSDKFHLPIKKKSTRQNRQVMLLEEEIKEYYAASWDIFTLSDLDLVLAKQLDDDHLRAVFVCIEAKENLKKLILPASHMDMVNNIVVGSCLEPLRGSTVLECIKLCGNDPYQGKFSAEVVIPILDSILDAGNSLREVSLPASWKSTEKRNKPPLYDFVERFSLLKLSEPAKCIDCTELVDGTTENSCRLCHKRVCADCDVYHPDEDGWNDPSDYPFVRTCNHCSINSCRSCEQNMRICGKCNSVYCSLCAKVDGIDAAQHCENEHCENWEAIS